MRGWGRALAISVVVLSVVSVGLELATFGRGLDFWDESWTLLMADRPGASRGGEVFLFQFLLHPVLHLVGRDVAAFRVVGLAAMCLAAWAATAAVTSCLRATGVAVTRGWAVVSTAAVVATCSVAYLGAGRVPGYRIVVVVALLLFVAGLGRWWAGGSPAWAALVGASGVLAFTGKPTSAAALAVLLLVALVVARVRPGLPVAGWAAAGAAATFCLVLVVAGMTPSEVVGYITSGLDTEKAGGSHGSWATMLGVSAIPLGALLVLGPIVYLPLVPAVHDVARNPAPGWPRAAQLAVGLTAPLVACLLGVWLLSQSGFAVQVCELVLPWPVGAAVLVVLLSRSAPKGRDRRAAALVVVLLALPYVVAVGTNTNFTTSMTQAAVFWALGVVAALSMAGDRWARTRRLLLPSALLLVTTTLVTQVVWTADTLEGHEVHSASRVTKLLGGHLMVSSATADLLDQLTALSDTYDLADRPSIDLTGYGAGYQLVLGTRPLGRASFFGTFGGADRGAAAALSRERCDDLRSAVVLYADHNPLSVASAASAVGLDVGSGYRTILSFHPTHGTQSLREQTIHVLLPDPTSADAGSCPAAPQRARGRAHQGAAQVSRQGSDSPEACVHCLAGAR